ncbi:MAG TPA: GNAT family N-acetyltransferase [Chitinophagales bacterium]|nr:GNAT family N-acetyltransferase [Chitinophagales bacterium]
MQVKIKIQQAKITDAKTIASLSDQLGYTSSEVAIQQRLYVIFQDLNQCVFTAIYNQQLVGWIHGFIALRVESDPFVEIGGLVVNEQYRLQGVGKLLVEKIYSWSLNKNCNLIRVRSNVMRKESHLFYKKLGFTELKEQKVYGLVLRKNS